MTKYEMNQKLEIFGLPATSPGSVHNGAIVTVVDLPGYSVAAPHAYGVKFETGFNVGDVLPCSEHFLRPYPPKLVNGRGNLDTKTTWAEFDFATGIDSNKFRTQPT
jgi:hypothetical protein